MNEMNGSNRKFPGGGAGCSARKYNNETTPGQLALRNLCRWQNWELRENWGLPPALSLEPHLVKCRKLGIRITPTHIVLRTVCAGQPIIPGLAEPVNCLPFDFLNEGFWCEETTACGEMSRFVHHCFVSDIGIN